MKCSECDKESVALGLCCMHYQRLRRHGDVSVVLPRGPAPTGNCRGGAAAGRHGLSARQVKLMLSDRVCEICGSSENLCVDHDHQTQSIRGVLCRKCNLGLGYFKDRAELLQMAVQYVLEKTTISGRLEL